MHPENKASSRNLILEHIRSTVSKPTSAEGVALKALTQALELHVAPYRLEAFAEVVERCASGQLPTSLDTLVDPLINDHRLHLWGAALRYQSRPALITILEEIIVRREYHFRSLNPEPVVIDAGANIGLATYYLRRSCKASKIICFEPNPITFEILASNSSSGKWPVELHCAAVSHQDGEASLTLSNSAPLAASMNPRNLVGDECNVTVPTLRLRPFLQQPIDLLKIDIEGSEADVLEDCEGALDSVENVFCEVHPIPGQSPSLLWRVLGVLERAGFKIHVARSPWSEKAHNIMPLMNAYRTYSLSVFATRLSR
jgi:FkbM family methyltransferase